MIAVASKTFTTIETMTNANSALTWLKDNGVADPSGDGVQRAGDFGQQRIIEGAAEPLDVKGMPADIDHQGVPARRVLFGVGECRPQRPQRGGDTGDEFVARLMDGLLDLLQLFGLWIDRKALLAVHRAAAEIHRGRNDLGLRHVRSTLSLLIGSASLCASRRAGCGRHAALVGGAGPARNIAPHSRRGVAARSPTPAGGRANPR